MNGIAPLIGIARIVADGYNPPNKIKDEIKRDVLRMVKMGEVSPTEYAEILQLLNEINTKTK